jgi:hypothetical protein
VRGRRPAPGSRTVRSRAGCCRGARDVRGAAAELSGTTSRSMRGARLCVGTTDGEESPGLWRPRYG